MRVATWRRDQLSSELIRSSSPLMATSLTSPKLGKRRSSSSLKQVKMVKFSLSLVRPLSLKIRPVLLPSMYALCSCALVVLNRLFEQKSYIIYHPPFNRSVQLNMDMCCWFLVFWSACHKGLTVKASCLHFTWRQKQGIPTFDWVTTAWVHLLPSITFTSRFLAACLSSELALNIRFSFWYGSLLFVVIIQQLIPVWWFFFFV